MRKTARRLAMSCLVLLTMVTCLNGQGQKGQSPNGQVQPPAKPTKANQGPSSLSVGFAEVDITPNIDAKRGVWLAGYVPGRRANKVHDPLFARCIVLSDQNHRVAMVSVDLIGMQFPQVKKIRAKLSDFDHVMVSSTHNHEGPDTIGLWGPNFVSTGLDPKYINSLTAKIVALVIKAGKDLKPAEASFGTVEDDKMVADRRLPVVKDSRIRTLSFRRPESTAAAANNMLGLIVQWNCHPEALGSKNKQVTADFPATTVATLRKQYGCPVVYFSGVLGGLMAPPSRRFKDKDGKWLREGQFEFAKAYGEAVADMAGRAVQNGKPISLTPFRFAVSPVAIPVTNPWYRTARLLKIVKRDVYYWTGDYKVRGELVAVKAPNKPTAIETEVGCLQLGAMTVFSMPGEVYPELVTGKFQNPVEKNVDFPNAKKEPTIASFVKDENWMLIGLANDEIGYIIPRCQWDLRAPFAYGRKTSQYGEINSCGADVAPIVMQAMKAQFSSLNGDTDK